MFSRFNVFRLLRDQFASVRNLSKRRRPLDLGSLVGLVAVPLGVVGCAYNWSWPLKGGAELMGTFSLTAGIMLAVFALLAAWRTRLAERLTSWGAAEQPDRSLIDEAVRHSLGATLASVAGAALSLWASASAAAPNANGMTSRAIAAVCYGASAYVGLLIVAVVVLAYAAYTDTMSSIERENRSLLKDPDRAALKPKLKTNAPHSRA